MKIQNFVLCALFFVIADAAYASADIPDELRDELRALASSRLNHTLKEALPTNSYTTMSFIITSCQIAPDLKIESTGSQTILEEVTCGSTRMREWCDENPGRDVIFTTASKHRDRTTLARFICDTERRDLVNNKYTFIHNIFSQYVITMITNVFVVFALIGIIACWYSKCTRSVPVHPSDILNFSNKAASDSFENITLNSSKAYSKSLSLNSFRSIFITVPKKFRIIV